MNYLEHLKRGTGVASDARNISSIIGAEDSTLAKFFAGYQAPPDVSGNNTATVVGAGIGGLYGATKGHGVLGIIGGASVARNVPALLRTTERRLALCNLGETGFAVACSLAAKRKSWGTQALAFVGGRIIAGAVTYFAGLRG